MKKLTLLLLIATSMVTVSCSKKEILGFGKITAKQDCANTYSKNSYQNCTIEISFNGKKYYERYGKMITKDKDTISVNDQVSMCLKSGKPTLCKF